MARVADCKEIYPKFSRQALLRLRKKGERGTVTVNEIARADGAKFSVAKKSGKRQRAKGTGNQPGVMIGPAKQVCATAIANAEAPSVNGLTC